MTAHAPSRRRVLSGGAALGVAVVGQGAGAGTARAATPPTYPASPYPATPVPSTDERHLMNRLGCGFSTATHAALRADGGAAAWLELQLTPANVGETDTAQALGSWFPDLADTPATKWGKATAGTKGGWEYAADFAGWSMLRQAYSSRQLLENMVGFWSNHLHVHADTDLGWVHRFAYDQVIRTYALGRFEDLLVAASLHPAMLLYLDNWLSVRGAPNENQGRELLELHTVGRAAGYTEAMVKDSAKILSGYTVDGFKTWNGLYDPKRHTTGPVQVLGFTSANAGTDGREVTVAYLKYLANHPATALNIARKLARHFVADAPSTDLVNHLAQTFRDSGTDITATLRALVAHPDFATSAGSLVRNPVEDFVATVRALQVAVRKPTADDSFANACIWVPQTTLLYQWPRPDGLPLGDAPWSSASRMLNSFRMHWNLIGGWWPTQDVTYRTSASWVPQARIRLDQWVDHLCRTLLGRTSDPRLLSAVCATTGYGPATVVSATHPLATWQFVWVAGTLLDSPDHMRR